MKRKFFAVALGLGAFLFNAGAWDYEGHHAVNELALASLPKDFGIELTPALKGRIAFLAGEPDRWRNAADAKKGTGDLPLAHLNGPDHYFTIENLKLYDLTPATLPIMRYDFAADIVRARTAHPERFPEINPAKNYDHTRELEGFLPWTINEYYEKLKSDFCCLKTFRKYGTPEEIANAQADCIYVMGVMGHFVGDGAQPLHGTLYFDGWTTNNNPKHYTTGPVTGVERVRIHSWIDGGYFKKTGGIKVDALVGKIQPATRIPNGNNPGAVFSHIMDYLVEQNRLVEPIYDLEKNGQLTGEGEKGLQARPFLEDQLVKGGQMLGNIWYTAWLEAPEDTYLETQLQLRNTAAPSTK